MLSLSSALAQHPHLSSTVEPWVLNLEITNPNVDDVNVFSLHTALDHFTPCRAFKVHDILTDVEQPHRGKLYRRKDTQNEVGYFLNILIS